MRSFVELLYREWSARRPVAVATVIETHGSSPRKPGAMMAVLSDGSVVGSISGGCVEGALYESCLDVLQGADSRIERYGPEGDLIAPGLTCGGSLSVLVERFDRGTIPILGTLHAEVMADRTAVMLTALSASGPQHSLVSDDRRAGLVEPGLVVRRFDSRPTMVVVGSTDFALETALAGMRLGYRVTVCDARPTFVTKARFPGVDEIVCEWPAEWIARQRDTGNFDERSVFVVLTHDPKIDIPVLTECLDSARWGEIPAFVGAMGSAIADLKRRRELTTVGITDEQLAALYSPIGLQIGNQGPAETAISIAAQIVASRTDRADPFHRNGSVSQIPDRESRRHVQGV